jgi:hypothetical protein
MRCTRCHATMIAETASEWGSAPIVLWACVLCGNRTDETISFNRIFRREETASEREARIMRQIRAYLEEVKL